MKMEGKERNNILVEMTSMELEAEMLMSRIVEAMQMMYSQGLKEPEGMKKSYNEVE